METNIEAIKEWQTLIAGILALSGALITTIILLRQHSFDKKRYRYDREKTEFYKRSLISDALCDLTEYSEKCFQHVYDKKELPKKPDSAIQILRENIEYSDLNTSKNLSEIVSFYQVHNSRIEDYEKVSEKEDILYDIFLLHHYFINLFPYARNETKSVKTIFPTKKEMVNSVKNAIGIGRYHRDKTQFSKILKQAESRRQIKEEHLKPKTVRQKIHNLICKLQTYYKRKNVSIM